jgi:hypothetical protein
MKKLIIALIVFFAITTACFSMSNKNNIYVGKYIFIHVENVDYIYQGECVYMSESIITIKHITQNGVKILSIPMHHVKKFYILEEVKE